MSKLEELEAALGDAVDATDAAMVELGASLAAYEVELDKQTKEDTK